MPKSEMQKLKMLYIADMLTRESDEEHRISTQQILNMLDMHGIQAERKSVYSDVALLQQYGMDIMMERGRNGGYWLASRNFEIAELKLLVDAVQSSKFLSAKKSRELIKKLESLAGKYEAQTLQRQVYVTNRVKSMNESIYYSIDKLHTAINIDRQISFKYFNWDEGKKQVFRNNGNCYVVSPYALVRDDENYYLIAYSEQNGEIRHFRVDKMTNLDVLESQKRTGKKSFENFDIAKYTSTLFGMFGGEVVSLEIAFDNMLANTVIDRFGKNVSMGKIDDKHFKIYIDAVMSPMFMGWLASFGGDAKLLAPESAVKKFKKHCKGIYALYK